MEPAFQAAIGLAPVARAVRAALALGGWLLLLGQTSASPIEVRDVRVPVFLADSPSAAAVIRIQKVYQSYQRRGFFRIGLLPAAVAEDVRIEIRQPARATEALAAAAAALRTVGNGRPVELKRVSIHTSGAGPPVLRAGVLEIKAQGAWEFSRDVTLATATNTMRVSRAVLVTAGPRAGQVGCGPGRSLGLQECLATAGPTPGPAHQPGGSER